jgi:hypothetical protein
LEGHSVALGQGTWWESEANQEREGLSTQKGNDQALQRSTRRARVLKSKVKAAKKETRGDLINDE